jgi:Co/Zn/Cd efflux system component
MADCCEDKSCAIEALKERQSGTLKIVLAINAVMFLVVFIAGILASSTALLSDSIDNLGDAITYALSLYVISRSRRDKAKVALFKGGLILAGGLFVLWQVGHRILVPTVPVFEMMSSVGLLALAANSICLALLWKHRSDDINMSSVWHCSRNDIASNLAVIVASGGVWLTQSGWPDVVVGLALALLLVNSARKVLAASWQEYKAS